MDEGLLRVARGLARQRGETLGRVISDYFQRGLRYSAETPFSEVRNGVPLLRRRPGGLPVTPELVKELLDGTG